MRRKLASELLASSNLNISEIAYTISIQDVRSFSKKFRSWNGITPREYRKIHAEKVKIG